MHLFFSPHPDDAVYSCGGRIAQLTRAGQPVTVYTFMAGAAPPEFRSTPFTDELFARWKLGDQPWIGRQAEDRAAVGSLGGSVVFGPHPDAVCRVSPQTGTALYPSGPAIFGERPPDDTLTVEGMAAALTAQIAVPPTAVYAPMGVGHHVDHQWVRDLALHLAGQYPQYAVYFYEEYPYMRGGRPEALKALRYFEARQVRLLRVRYVLDEEALARKIHASGLHRSQRDSFWADDAAMDADLRAYHAHTGGECYWRLVDRPASLTP